MSLVCQYPEGTFVRRKGSFVRRKENLVRRKENFVRRKENLVRRKENLVRRKENLVRRKENLVRRKENFVRRGSLVARREGNLVRRETLHPKTVAEIGHLQTLSGREGPFTPARSFSSIHLLKGRGQATLPDLRDNSDPNFVSATFCVKPRRANLSLL